MKVYVVCSYDSDNNNIESFVFTTKEKAQEKVKAITHSHCDEYIKERGIYASGNGGWVEFIDGTFLEIDLSEVELDV